MVVARRGPRSVAGPRKERQWSRSSAGVHSRPGSPADTATWYGAGAAGCVLTTRLSADPSTNVPFVEAGPAADRHSFVRFLLGMAFWSGKQEFDWGYETEPEPAPGGRTPPLPRGRRVGGSGPVNGDIHV